MGVRRGDRDRGADGLTALGRRGRCRSRWRDRGSSPRRSPRTRSSPRGRSPPGGPRPSDSRGRRRRCARPAPLQYAATISWIAAPAGSPAIVTNAAPVTTDATAKVVRPTAVPPRRPIEAPCPHSSTRQSGDGSAVGASCARRRRAREGVEPWQAARSSRTPTPNPETIGIFGDSILYVMECASCTACDQPDVCSVGPSTRRHTCLTARRPRRRATPTTRTRATTTRASSGTAATSSRTEEGDARQVEVSVAGVRCSRHDESPDVSSPPPADPRGAVLQTLVARHEQAC